MTDYIQTLPLDIQSMLNDFILIMQEHYGAALHSILLYGSYARGEAHEESDIDVLLVLDKKEVDIYEELTDIISLTYDLDIEYSQALSVFPTSLVNWVNSYSFFTKQVKKDSIYLWTNILA